MNVNMKEKEQGWARVQGVTASTFERFVEWAYKGYYTAATHVLDLEDSSEDELQPTVLEEEADDIAVERIEEIAPEPDDYAVERMEPAPGAPAMEDDTYLRSEPEEALSPFAFGKPKNSNSCGKSSNKRRSKKKKKKVYRQEEYDWVPPASFLTESRSEMKENFIHRKPEILKSAIEITPPRRNQFYGEDYTEVFLCHAQLYVFADEKDIQELKTLALENLHATLAIYDLYARRTGDIISLLRYVYANTSERRDRPDDLQKVLTEYCGYEMDTLMRDKRFKKLMIEEGMNKHGGRLIGDFMTMVMKRIKDD